MAESKRTDESPRNDGINDNTYELLFGDKIRGTEELDKVKALSTIDLFTLLPLKRFKNIKYLKEQDLFEYDDGKLKFTFKKLSNIFAEKRIKKELLSTKRFRTCHKKSIEIAPYFENSKVITGYVTIHGLDILHSVVELQIGGGSIVLDYTRNIIIPREDYDNLMGFEELTYINGDNCLEDCARIFDNITLGSKPYVVFRNELRRDMERNINMFPISPERQQEINQFFSDREEHYQKVKSQTR